MPPEWIAAHGLRPERAAPRGADADALASLSGIGICPYARAFAHHVRSHACDAAVFTTTCDQMRRMAELIAPCCDKPLFVMHVPTSCESVASFRGYRQELLRLGKFLVDLGGHEPTTAELVSAMETHEALRASRRVQPAVRAGAVPIMLLGGPVIDGSLDLADLVERAGGYVALDATESGERTLPKPFDRRRLNEDPVGELVDAYFGAIPDAFRRPNAMLYQWLRDAIAARGLRGIVLLHYVWCDTWRAEAGRLKAWSPIPVLPLDSDEGESARGRALSRLQAFIEVLAQ